MINKNNSYEIFYLNFNKLLHRDEQCVGVIHYLLYLITCDQTSILRIF